MVQPTDPLFFHDAPLYLEVTETAAFDYFDLCMSVLGEVKARCGAHIVVDDFGSGHSDLQRVLQLNPDVVKLDMSLVRDIHITSTKQKVVRSMTALSKDMGMTVVAEGVETQAERDCLVEVVERCGGHRGRCAVGGAPHLPGVALGQRVVQAKQGVAVEVDDALVDGVHAVAGFLPLLPGEIGACLPWLRLEIALEPSRERPFYVLAGDSLALDTAFRAGAWYRAQTRPGDIAAGQKRSRPAERGQRLRAPAAEHAGHPDGREPLERASGL